MGIEFARAAVASLRRYRKSDTTRPKKDGQIYPIECQAIKQQRLR